ncbi:MAG: T9SS type A sorting domain-containing protein [Bacteroidetes bacterium]|nr:T9SS type A sorting domain-containing protein [Bacteroidota bacterium]
MKLLSTLAIVLALQIGVNAQGYKVTDFSGGTGPYGMAIDSRGYLWVSNNSSHTITYNTGGNVKTAAGAQNQAGYTDGQGVGIRFSQPKGIAVTQRAGSEVLVVADAGNNAIRFVSIANLTTILSTKVTDITGFNDPCDVEVDASGNIYVADRMNYVVKKIDLVGQVTIIAGQEGKSGTDDGDATTKAKFTAPTGLYVDGSDVYVADGGALRKISGGKVTTIDLKPDDSWGDVGWLFNCLDIEKMGSQWVLSDGCSIRIFDAGTTKYITMAGANYAGQCGYKNGMDTFARFQNVYTMKYDATNEKLLVADQGNNKIRQIEKTTIAIEEAAVADFNLYPNPASDVLVVEGIEDNFSLSIYNLAGSELISVQSSAAGGSTSIDVSNLQQGVYLVSIRQSQGITTQKLVIQ